MGIGNSKKQAQIEAQALALQVLNVETALISVLRQLDRFDRVTEEGTNRPPSVRPNFTGDDNHTTVEDNQMALTAKLMCLTGILQTYNKPVWNESCARYICNWYRPRQGVCSQKIVQAVRDCALACKGNYQALVTSPTAPPLSDELKTYAQGLALACEDYHGKQDKVNAEPEAYLQKVNKKREEVKKQVPDFNIGEFIESLDGDLESFSTDMPTPDVPVPKIPGSFQIPTFASQASSKENESTREAQEENLNKSHLPLVVADPNQEPKTYSDADG